MSQLKQSKKHSVYESLFNVAIGYSVSIVIQLTLYPLLGMKLTLADNLVLGLIFTIISIIRTYGVRRLFNRWHQHQTRLHSLIEVTANTTIGIVTSIASQMIIFPLYGVNISFLDNVIISLTFLIISIARGYVLRRAFNRWHQHVNNAGRINFDAKDIGLNAVIVQPVSGHNFDKPASQS